MKKILLGIISLMLAIVCTVSCGGGSGTSSGGASNGGNSTIGGENELPSEVKNPFTLNVFNFNGGYGSEWIRAVEARYEKEKAGKKFTVNGVEYDGVDVNIDPVKKTLGEMASSYNFSTNHIYFHEDVWYMNYLRQGNMFADMTEALTTENPYEPGKTLLSKLSKEQQDFYNIDGKYYGIPHYAGYVGINYNIDLFNEYGFWLKDGYSYDGNTNNLAKCFTKNDSEKTAGPDGQKGTDDDGLPTTYNEFFILCGYVKQRSLFPLTWDYRNRGIYLNWFTQSLVASYEGAEQMTLNYTFDGTAKNLVSVDDNGNIKNLGDTVITTENGYELAKQAGKYYGLTFIEEIIENGWYQAKDGMTNTDAQRLFISENKDGQSAMLIDGVWWENESASIFAQMERLDGISRKDRNFGFMPFPAATEEEAAKRAENYKNGEKAYTLLDTHTSLCFIGKGIDEDARKIAIDFIQFAYTDESLVEFSNITDTTKALNYTISAEDKAKMSSYGRSIITLQEKSEIVHSFSKSTFWQNNETTLADYNYVFNATVGGNTAFIPMDSFAAGKSAKEYFDGYYTYRKNTLWNELAK